MPNLQSLRNIRRNARPANPTSPARLHPALRFRRTVPSARRHERGHWNPPKSRRISPLPAAKQPPTPPSWVHSPCRAPRGLKRQRGSLLPLLMLKLTTIHQYGSPSPFQRNQTKFGRCGGGTRRVNAKRIFCRNIRTPAKPPRFHRRRENPASVMEPSWSDCGLFGIEQARKPLAHITGLVEMVGHALRAPAHRECQTIKIGHDGEYRFVGDIVADENRTAALERFVGHQFEHAGGLVKT